MVHNVLTFMCKDNQSSELKTFYKAPLDPVLNNY